MRKKFFSERYIKLAPFTTPPHLILNRRRKPQIQFHALVSEHPSARFPTAATCAPIYVDPIGGRLLFLFSFIHESTWYVTALHCCAACQHQQARRGDPAGRQHAFYFIYFYSKPSVLIFLLVIFCQNLLSKHLCITYKPKFCCCTTYTSIIFLSLILCT